MQSKYEILEVVGEGAFGIVMKCRNKETNEIVAIKKFKGIEEEIVQKSMIRELKALKRLKHDNIVQLKDCFKKKGQLYLAIEFLPKNLLQLLENNPSGLEQPLIKKIMFQLSKALLHIHNNDLIHRDIKPENILLSEDNTVKLCDFGFARALPEKSGALTDYVATRWYRAPEILLGVTNYGKEMDYWAMGCIMGELIDGRPMFPGDDEFGQLNVIQEVLGNFPSHLLETFYSNPRYAGYKLEEISKPETIKRRYMGSLNKSGINFMKALLKLDPKDRLSGNDIINHHYFDDIRGGGEEDCYNSKVLSPNVNLNIKKCIIVPNTNVNINLNQQDKIKTNVIENKYQKKFIKVKHIVSKSPPNEHINLNQNININNAVLTNNNANTKKTQQNNIKRFDNNQTAYANQLLLETFYHPSTNNKNDQYNFGIDTNFELNSNLKEKKHKQLNSTNVSFHPNNINNTNTINNTIQQGEANSNHILNPLQYIQNEAKPQNKLIKNFKPFHLEDITNQIQNQNKFNYNFLPQIQTHRNLAEEKWKNISNYNY